MSVRKHYACDLCNAAIDDKNGIAIVHRTNAEIKPVYLATEGAGHHLCNSCVRGLRGMIADLDRTNELHAEMDRA